MLTAGRRPLTIRRHFWRDGRLRIAPTGRICRCPWRQCRRGQTCIYTAASTLVRWQASLSSTPVSTARVSPATSRPKGGGKQITDDGCPERLEPGRSNLGMAQETWLYDQFRDPPAKWNIITQEQLMAEFKERLGNGETAHWSEDWNGFPATRTRLLTQMRATGLANPVVIGGDIHSFWANDLKVDFDNPQAADRRL